MSLASISDAPTSPHAPPRWLEAYRSRLAFWIPLGLIAAVFIINLTWHLGDQNLGDWDESRHAVSAFEMLQRGDLLVNTWRGSPDYWNLKPPLSFWPIMLSYHLFGFSTIALHLPAAIESVGTFAVVTVFVHRRAGRFPALVSAAVLATCYPLIGSHSGRSGDPDALFVLFFTIGLLALLGAHERPRLLLLFTTTFSAAFLTKSWHAGVLIVVGGVVLLVRGRASAARRSDYALALLGFLPVLAWAIARFSFDGTRFFSSMVQYDLLSRSATPLEGNGGGPLYYVVLLTYFVPWALLLIPLVLRRSGLSAAAGPWRRSLWIGPAICAAAVTLLYSLAKSKLSWYEYPAFPALAVLIGVVAGYLGARSWDRTTTITVVAVVVATLACEAYVLDKIPRPTVPAQLALSRLRSMPTLTGERIYLDSSLALSARVKADRSLADDGDWPQSLRASTLLNDGLLASDGGVRRFLTAPAGTALMLVHRGSADDRAVQGHRASVVTTVDGYSVVALKP